MKLSRKQQAIEARRASDPIAQKMERTDIDYTDPDQLPTAPRAMAAAVAIPIEGSEPRHNYFYYSELECCADWRTGMKLVDGMIEDVSSGTNHDVYIHAGGKPFAYCPWCGVFRKDFERDFAIKAAELKGKGLL